MIKDLDIMEIIVAKNDNLSWDGWNVVELTPSKDAMFKTNGEKKRLLPNDFEIIFS